MGWELWRFWRVEGLDKEAGVREQGTENRGQGTGKNRQRQGRRPGAKARFFDGDGIAQAEARAYLRNKGNSKVKNKSRFPAGMTNKKDKYGDSGCARMTTSNGCARMTSKKDRSRFPSGITNKKDKYGDSGYARMTA